jgi:hypothetical protein
LNKGRVAWCSAPVGFIQPVVSLTLLDADDRIGKGGLAICCQTTDVVCVHVRDIDLVDLFSRVPRRAKVVQ